MNTRKATPEYQAPGDSEAAACRRLWAAVLGRALLDASGKAGDITDGVTKRRAIASAQDWIMGKGRDFRMVCFLAGVDPDVVHERWVSGRINTRLLQKADGDREAAE